MDDRRPEVQPAYDGTICTCGEAWFVLHGDNTAPNGAVCLARDGTVTGYTGRPHCMSCGAPAVVGGT